MYIWVCGRAVPSKYNGMQGSFEFEQAQMLKDHGNKVVYVAINVSPRTLLKWKDIGLKKQEINGIKTYNVYLPFGFTGKGRNTVRCLFTKRLFSLVEHENGFPECIHVHYPSMCPYTVFKRFKKSGLKLIATEHWTGVLRKRINKYQNENLQWFVTNADSFICVSEPLKESVIALTGKEDARSKITVLPNIVNDCFTYKYREVDYKHFVFCAVGRLVPVKCFDLLIRAFQEVFEGDKRIFLKIVGDGNQMKHLKDLIVKLHVEEQVELTGVKTRTETAEEVQNSDVLVCSSNLETFGVPVIEGAACGKPVITTDVFGVPDFVDESVGIMIPKNDLGALKEALKYMYGHRDEYDDASIAEKTNSIFSEDAVISSLMRIYKKENGVYEYKGQANYQSGGGKA